MALVIVEKEKKHLSTTFYTPHILHTYYICDNTILKLPANLLNISTPLQADPKISNNVNSVIFKAVLDFQSGCFGME